MGKGMTVEPLERDAAKGSRRALLLVAAGALCLGAIFIAVILVLGSCSASVSSAIKTDGSARISVEAEMPAVVAAKLRKLASAGATADSSAGASAAAQNPVFDAQSIRKALEARPGVQVLETTQPKPDSIRVLLSVRSLAALAASPDLGGSGILTMEKGPSWTECRFRLARGEAKALSALFPGLDPALMETLSPPALEDDPLSLEEYKTMLKSVFGGKTMPAVEAAALKLSITAPAPVLASSGGQLSGSTLTASIPLIEMLALEKPIELRLRWKSGE
jgi:hypothetical protein